MNTHTNVARHPAAPLLAKNVIAVASGKGGVGKTWLSISLSHALALQRQKVLLFDGDLGLANVDIQLGLMPKNDIASVLAGKRSFEQAVTRFADGGFDILAGRSGSGSLAGLGQAHLNNLRAGLVGVAEGYQMVVLDLAAGLDQGVQTLATVAGTCLVVTTDEPTAITDAYALIKMMVNAGRGASLRVVVNLADSKNEGRKTYDKLLKACENFLNMAPPLAGVVRRDAKVKDSIRRQMPILLRHPTSTASGDIARIADQLMNEP
ncbi:MAG: MinD/ParA family protein [Alphaproteobacteria bacterium]|jgi:flagellar biosynthesis protein FlhG|nr:MinD/ParA family protein [Alphaproteobacteria bacterium]MDP6516838.1 MinD/ParA family protein [Alphaproteobacteria bacterium]